MSKNLVIVESPAKAKTIGRFLGSDYKIMASYGHVRDLPTKKLGIDVDKKFEPTYVIPPKAKQVIADLTKALNSSQTLYLATDLDREGEAIAWHLTKALKPKVPVKRITFHEITKAALEEAMKQARGIDENLVEAQAARRILDRLVGYTLSPFLWKKVAARLSAGRVQSVAVRLLVEREREIRAFKAVEYWSLIARLKKAKNATEFNAALVAIDGKTLGRTALKEDVAKKLESSLKKATFTVSSVQKTEVKRTPPPPFTTSTLQQEAYRHLGYSAKRTMTVAQHLYEDGFITYMRTDSVALAKEAITQAREVIKSEFGAEYVPASPRFFANKTKGAQEAHEAIRPVRLQAKPGSLKGDLDGSSLRLYELIWKRALASQMSEARFERTSVDITAVNCLFRATGQIPLFLGYLKVYIEGRDDVEEQVEGLLPDLDKGDVLDLLKLLAEQHFTEPPARYTEATLVKALEELGIGRPSTYAPTIGTIEARGYVVVEEKKLKPTDIAELVTDLLTEHFADVVNYQFTAELEEKLDDIAEGKRDKVAVLQEFYGPYAKLLKVKEKELTKKDLTEEKTDIECPECHKGNLVIKVGRFGRFYACSRYPDCEYTDKMANSGKPAPEPVEVGRKCPVSGHELVRRVGRYGTFIGCSDFPKCKYVEQQDQQKLDVKCPKSGDPLVVKRTRRGKVFWGCSAYPKCDFATWNDPTVTPPSLEEYEQNKAKKKEKGQKKFENRNSNIETNSNT